MNVSHSQVDQPGAYQMTQSTMYFNVATERSETIGGRSTTAPSSTGDILTLGHLCSLATNAIQPYFESEIA